jgi:hypothetical protein
MTVLKREAVIPFQGGIITIRNAFDYPERDQAGNPTGNTLKARAGVFINLPKQPAIDISGCELDTILAAAICKRIKDNRLAQSILKENDEAALAGLNG